MNLKHVVFLLSLFFFFTACQKEEILEETNENFSTEGLVEVTKHDGRPFDSGTSKHINRSFTPGPGGGVMMQAFYWDVTEGGVWWNILADKVDDWSSAGIESIWLPPATKAQGGGYSMGYDPSDYGDFGNYNQQGTVETRFGSRSELENLIDAAHGNNMKVYADIVLNHCSGGDSESNPFTGGSTWTDFTNVASGMFPRDKNHFHPNANCSNDSGVFGGFPDLAHCVPYVQDWLWKRTDGVGKYYRDVMEFDGWRFDYVKGFEPWVVSTWNYNIGGFAVGEYWDGNAATLEWWANEANSSAFDFACYYRMNDAFSQGNLSILRDADMLWKRNPFKAVTFVANHDTDIIYNHKMLAYAYILTHEGYPTIFYKDYEEWLSKERLNNLIWIHNNKATGNTTILHADNDEYLARRNGWNGNPGLIVYLNTSNSWKERWVPTNWSNKQIKDFTGHSGWYPTTQGGGWVKIQCPPNSYSVWSLNE